MTVSPGWNKPMALDLGPNVGMCDAQAQSAGGLAYIKTKEFTGCVPVSGKVINIGVGSHSIMEGFEITNFNWHAYGNQPPAAIPQALPGNVDGFQYGV